MAHEQSSRWAFVAIRTPHLSSAAAETRTTRKSRLFCAHSGATLPARFVATDATTAAESVEDIVNVTARADDLPSLACADADAAHGIGVHRHGFEVGRVHTGTNTTEVVEGQSWRDRFAG